MFEEAIEYYEKCIQTYFDRVLTITSIFKEGEKKEELDTYDNLFCQSAYNLIMIHKHLGNHAIVKQLINDYMYIQ
jgi:hypothetical protein